MPFERPGVGHPAATVYRPAPSCDWMPTAVGIRATARPSGPGSWTGDLGWNGLEQPRWSPPDAAGHQELAAQLRLALDESHAATAPRSTGLGSRRLAGSGACRPWRARSQAPCCPAPGLQPRLMLSTAFENRASAALAQPTWPPLQQRGPTPTAPGLAPGWEAGGGPCSACDPQQVWASGLGRQGGSGNDPVWGAMPMERS